MKAAGIICEYNPFHNGHKGQFDLIRQELGADCAIVCLMSGNYVQRGAPAIVDKSLRAKAAVAAGADLVLELPVTACLSSAEGFAAKGVAILSPFCTHLSFGCETKDTDSLRRIAESLLSPEFSDALHLRLADGLSFPAARQAALTGLGADGTLLTQPNNILAVEYSKAILSQNSSLLPLPIYRKGSYHDPIPDKEAPSATSLRNLLLEGSSCKDYIPPEAAPIFENAVLHTVDAGSRAILGQLRRMTESDFAVLPYGSEGLWRKLMHAVRKEATLEDILTAVKSKRYTRTRLDRMVMCAFLGITEELLDTPVPYTRVLALGQRGRQLLNTARKTGSFLNAGEQADHPYQQLENRWGDLYGLFATQAPDAPGCEIKRRNIVV